MSLLTHGAVRVGLVPAVVLDVEADAGGDQPEQDRQRHGLPPRPGHEHQQRVRAPRARRG